MRPRLIAVLLWLVASLSLADEAPVLRLYDANGQVIGPLASYGGSDGVFLTVNGVVVFARISRIDPSLPYSVTLFAWSNSSRVDYESANCSGTPAIEWQSGGPRPSVSMRQGTETVLYVGSDTNTQQLPVASAIVDGRCISFPFTLPLVRAESSFSLTQHYPVPLTVR
jgi:hypothetical protein